MAGNHQGCPYTLTITLIITALIASIAVLVIVGINMHRTGVPLVILLFYDTKHF